MATKVIKYVGRKHDFIGKTLWEILGNLKGCGVGRYVVRSKHEKYPERSFMKIVKTEILPNPSDDSTRKMCVWVEKTFRGRKLPNLVKIESASYKTDYRLIHKEEEAEYCKVDDSIQFHTIPRFIEYPPLLKEMIIKQYTDKNLPPPEDLKLPITLRKSTNKYYALEDPEKSGVLPIKLTPTRPKLYSNIE